MNKLSTHRCKYIHFVSNIFLHAFLIMLFLVIVMSIIYIFHCIYYVFYIFTIINKILIISALVLPIGNGDCFGKEFDETELW